MGQTILLGLGGTGSRVVNNVARELRKHGTAINDGQVICAVLDTNQEDNGKIANSGTAIPVIPTCDEMNIDAYLALYANRDPHRWCPYSRSFGEENMLAGAAEMRVKSRIAFMDTMNSSKIFKLQKAIEDVFHNRPGTPEQIRVMVVSSLAGGTGSGMFIQVALWLRKFFKERRCEATIRGIFLLPDVFIRTLNDISDNPRKKLYHYANAYAAIRELNAINKVIKGNIKLEKPIIIDDLFDSRQPCAKPVFDNAFFIDDIDANGAAFETIGEYERMVAQVVYMQLYAPMYSELISVEDNLYRSFESSKEPVFGSCGTAKAEYPTEDIIEYCALRAFQDSIAEGWYRIDDEIDYLKNEEKQAEKDGIIVAHPISRRDTFVRLFDEKSQKTNNEIGKGDRLFVSIKKDVFNEKHERTGNGDEVIEVLTCKVEAFMNAIDEEIQKSVTENGDYKKVAKIGKELPDPKKPEAFKDGLAESLKGIRSKEIDIVKKVIANFDENCKTYADAIIRELVPLDMGSVNSRNEKSLYGLFLKKDPNGADFFVHPIAAKYLLYKLSQKIEENQKVLTPDDRKKKALNGDKTTSFDNPKTRKTENLEDYWKQVGHFISKGELKHFIERYKIYNTANMTLCMQYETELLKQMVLKELSNRVAMLIEEIEKMFKDFVKMNKKLADDIKANVNKNEKRLEKTLYVLGKGKFKEAKYQSLGVDLTGRNDAINKEIISSVYGKFCATLRPSVEENKKYVDKSIIAILYDQLVASFKVIIAKKHTDSVKLDIISAIKEESDLEFEERKKAKQAANMSGEDEPDPFANVSTAEQAEERHNAAIVYYRNRLLQMAAPFLRAQPDESLAVISNVEGMQIDKDNEMWMTTVEGKVLRMPIQTKLTFWGFHPDIVEKYPDIEAVLSVNKETSASDGYSQSELCCYSSIYGVKAEAVDKFNEQNGGDYYTHYSAVISTMITSGNEVDTPHLDKTWHEILPYVSRARENVAAQKFYKAFWRGIAYGRIRIDNHGKYQISNQTEDSYGNVSYEYSTLLEGGRPVGAKEITRLLKALRQYPSFESMITPQLEERFNRDVEDMTTYIGTDIVNGLLTQGDLNPVNIVVRYGSSQGYDSTIKSDLIGGLSEILREVAAHYKKNRNDEQINEARIKLCYKIYENSSMTQKGKFFGAWIDDFKRLGLAVSEDDTGFGNVEETDII